MRWDLEFCSKIDRIYWRWYITIFWIEFIFKTYPMFNQKSSSSVFENTFQRRLNTYGEPLKWPALVFNSSAHVDKSNDEKEDFCNFRRSTLYCIKMNYCFYWVSLNTSFSCDFISFCHYSSTSISNNISSTSSLHISSDQTLRDLYSNTRGSVTSPRKIYFRRVKRQEKNLFFLLFF